MLPINQSQRSILDKLILYMSKKNIPGPEYKSFIERFKKGYCAGFSSLWVYSRWLQTQPKILPAVDRDDYDWFRKVVDDVIGWNGAYPLNQHTSQEFDRFIALIEAFQNPDYVLLSAVQGDLDVLLEDDVKELGESSPSYRKPKKEYSIASLFNLEQLKKLLTAGIIHPYRLIYISSFNHATALFFDGINYYYFNPNDTTGEKRISCNSPDAIDELAKSIFMANCYSRAPNSFSPLGFKIFSMGQTAPVKYPSPQEIFDRIGLSEDTGNFMLNKQNMRSTSLQQAAKCGCLESVKYFLYKNLKNVDELCLGQNKKRYTALTFAIVNKHFDVALELLKAGASLLSGDGDEANFSLLFQAKDNPDPVMREIKEILLAQYNIDLDNKLQVDDMISLCKEAGEGNKAMVSRP